MKRRVIVKYLISGKSERKSYMYSIIRKSLDATPLRSTADNSSLLEKAIACNRGDSFAPRIYSRAGYTSARFRRNRAEDLSSTTASLQLYREIYGRSVYRSFFFRRPPRGGTKSVGKKHFYDPYPDTLHPSARSLVPVETRKRNSEGLVLPRAPDVEAKGRRT